MRRWNALLTGAILVLFLTHAILGGFQLLGADSSALRTLARACAGLTAVHAAIGAVLTVKTLLAQRKAGAAYVRLNALFWARRLSGLAVLILLALHMFAFGYTGPAGAYRLRPFGNGSLAGQALLVASLAVHVLSNVRPLAVSLGMPGMKRHAGEILAVLGGLLLFMAVAFAVYWLRWRAM